MADKLPMRFTVWREVWGIVLLTAAVLLTLAYWSYDWGDISVLRVPANEPLLNFIGPAGAWTAFVLFMSLGICAYLVPVLLGGLGVFLLISPQSAFAARAGWGTVAVFLMALLAGIKPDFAETYCRSLNIAGLPGGLVGHWVAHRLLAGVLGEVGAAILAGGLLCASLLMCLGRELLRRLWLWPRDAVLGARDRWRAFLTARRSRLELLGREQRQVTRQKEALEKALRRHFAQPPAEARDVPAPAEARPARPAPAAAPAPVQSPDDAPPAPPKPARSAAMVPPVKTSVAAAPPAAAIPAASGAGTGVPSTPYRLPPVTLLSMPAESERQIDGDLNTTARILKETLAEFGIECEVTNIERGPVVTRYELLPAPGIRVENIVKLSNNLALTLKATSVRVQAPIPGKGVVGIEVPNAIAVKVYLREILEGERWQQLRAAIPLVLGKDVGGNDLIADLAAMPHLLIAGATGSGKTVCMNSILAGMLMSRTPDELRLILVDPKIVEFSAYNNLPHLATPVITDHKKVIFGLRWAITEMNKRYQLFARAGVRNIAGYNERMRTNPPAAAKEEPESFPLQLPYIAIVIDELADLMLVARADVENAIARLAQLSRAVGIHMILATQRPSVNVITGTIKANFPARISFQVAQKVDSRTILDTSGADKLLGRGDMLFLPPGSSKLIRAQGAMTTDDDIHAIVNFIKEQPVPQRFDINFNEERNGKTSMPGLPGAEDDDNGDDDAALLEAATEIIRETRRASVSLLQRRLKIGYNRAGRLMDALEERGIVGPARGSDPREILIDLDGEVPDNAAADSAAAEETTPEN